jgi:LacI family transcriptional regulator
MAVTIYDVAAKAGVSITTVSHVMHNRKNIPESTRNRVLQVMRDINFVPNRIAQRLVTKKTQTIALLIPTIDNPFFAELYNGLEDYTERYRPGYRVMIGNIRYSVEKETALIRSFRQELLDGYIVVSNNPDNEEILELIEENIPVVFAVNDPAAIGGRPLVTYNNYEMAYQLTQHLVDLGHRRFGYLTAIFEQSDRAQSRFRGFHDCLQTHAIPFDRSCFINGEEYSSRCGYNSVLHLMRRKSIPTALFCANDVLAIGALHGIRERGLCVPHDLSLVGYDDIPASAYIDPPLTTVNINPTKIGYHAARLLFKLIEGYEGDDRDRVIPGRLILRSSCGPPPASA